MAWWSKHPQHDYLILLGTSVFLAAGAGASALHAPTAKSILWAAGGVVGLISAVKDVVASSRNKEVGSDTLAVLSLLGTLLTNEMFAAAVLALMLATGRSLERWAEGKANRELKSLLARVPRIAHLITAGDEIADVPVDAVRVGDPILVRSGEVTPVDGTLITDGLLDESALTGEPMPVRHEEGGRVVSGVVNAGNSLRLVATSTAAESTYAGIIQLVEQARAGTSHGVRIANQWARRFVPLSLLIAGLAGLLGHDIRLAIAVLVAATPCPLILAVPVAIVAGMSNAAKQGAIIKGGAVLERLARAKIVLLDKTGTLTHGGPKVSEINVAPGVDADIALKLAASLEQASPHIVASAIVAAARQRLLELSLPTNVEENHGTGITGTVDGFHIFVGQVPEVLPTWCTVREPLLVAIEIDGIVSAILGLADPVRIESAEMVASLRREGVERILLVTGDRAETAQAVGNAVGIDEIHARCSPADKLAILQQQRARTSGSIIVVGDGINDAPALAAADVGIAMGARGASSASEAADVVIVDDAIDRLAIAIRISKRSRARALQAAGLGMALSLVAMLFAAIGQLTASEGAVLQEAIDFAAIVWALTAIRSV